MLDRTMIGSESAARSKRTKLPPELVHKALQRLGIAALLITVSLGVGVAAGRGARGLGVPSAFVGAYDGIAAGAMAASLGVFWLSRARPIDGRRILDLGLFYQVVVALAVSMSENLAPLPAGYMVRGVSFVCVLVLVFPLIVPTTLGKCLLASFASASTGPLALAITVTLGNPMPSLGIAVLLFLPSFVCAGLAFSTSHIIHGLGRELAAAQQLGSYKLVEPLGRGGMGEVWRAEHRRLKRAAAIKLIRPEALGIDAGRAEALLQRFEREANAIASLRSPHTVDLFDFGLSEDERFYYVMELLEGLNLEQLVSEHGPIPPGRMVRLMRQVCHSLAEAHDHGLIHRDIKPANIIVGRYGSDTDFIKVLDFGIATTCRSGEDDSATLTQVRGHAGTPAFLAPELTTRHFDHRADIYAIGCVAYYLVTGALVFDEPTSMRTILAHVHDEPAPPPARIGRPLAPDVESIIMRCLRKSPEERPASARALAAELAACRVEPWTDEQSRAWWQERTPCHV